MQHYNMIPKKLAVIESKIKNWNEDIALDGKNIQTAIIEQPSLIAFYDQTASEAGYLQDLMDMEVKRIRAERFKFIRENFGRDYTDSAIQKAVDGDREYLKIYEIYIEVKEVYARCRSIVESFKQRSYSLNNLIKVYENELGNITIRLQ